MSQSSNDQRFTLEPGKWYAMLLLGDEFHSADTLPFHTSPIYVERVTPLKTGKGEFKLTFFHANYPEGVQGKEYRLQTIYRGEQMLILLSSEHSPPRFLHITPINKEWLQLFFPAWPRVGDDAQEILNYIWPFNS